jgi:DUF4097 and DUF4098 domain-containing protein YvlB
MLTFIAKSIVVLAGLALLVSLVNGCNPLDFAPLSTAEATLTAEFQVAQPPKIVVETFNGSIDVSPSANNEVVVEVTKRASGFDRQTSEDHLAYVEVSMVQKEDTIHVRAERIGMFRGNSGADVVIAVPGGSQLDLRSSNGAVVCEGISGRIVAKTSNAKLEVYEGRGPIDVTSSNGPITIEAQDAKVVARTSNARIIFHGTLTAEQQTFKTSNGRIELGLPADAQFRIEASTSNSRVQCDFPVQREDDSRKNRRLFGLVGKNPACSIVAHTSNAGIDIRPLDAQDSSSTNVR